MSDYQAAVLADNPTSYWRLGELASPAADVQGVNNGTYNAGTTLGVTGLLTNDANKAMQVGAASSGQGMTLTAAGQLAINTGTVEIWIKNANSVAGYRAAIAKDNAYGLFLHSDVLVAFDWTAGTDRSSGINLADGLRHYVALTFNSGVASASQLWVDGLAAGAAFTYTVQLQTQILKVGTSNSAGQEFANGVVDEAAIYPAMLSSGQIAAHYAAGITGTAAPQVLLPVSVSPALRGR